jgi:putative ABC transport system permease protein
VTPDDYTDDRAKRLVDREFNLSFTRGQQPQHNEWWPGAGPKTRPAPSAWKRALPRPQPQAGRHAAFDIGGVQTESRITSLRKVDWGSMRANFFVMYPVSQMDDVPITYMSAFRRPRTGF